jgi:hypothetical protein
MDDEFVRRCRPSDGAISTVLAGDWHLRGFHALAAMTCFKALFVFSMYGAAKKR